MTVLWRKPEVLEAFSQDIGIPKGEMLEIARELSEQEDPSTLALVTSLISLVLYLCSANRDLRDSRGSELQPRKPKLTKTKKGLRAFPPDRVSVWEVGYRIGAALRKAVAASRDKSGDGTHASPIPHVRKAHWHSFWTGPKDDPEQRRLVLKWLPPIPVGVRDSDDILPTFRSVD